MGVAREWDAAGRLQAWGLGPLLRGGRGSNGGWSPPSGGPRDSAAQALSSFQAADALRLGKGNLHWAQSLAPYPVESGALSSAPQDLQPSPSPGGGGPLGKVGVGSGLIRDPVLGKAASELERKPKLGPPV